MHYLIKECPQNFKEYPTYMRRNTSTLTSRVVNGKIENTFTLNHHAFTLG